MSSLKLITLFSLSIAFSLISNELLNIDNLVISYLSNQLTNTKMEEFINFQKKWQWLSYALIPLVLLLKITVIAAILDVGCFFFDKKSAYKKLFTIVTKAEFIFLLAIVFKTIWFYFFQPDYSLVDLQYFYPLSIINIIGYEGLQRWFVYPLQVFNLFELIYWIILSYLLSKELKITTDNGLFIVTSSYGIALFIWIFSVMFFTLNMS